MSDLHTDVEVSPPRLLVPTAEQLTVLQRLFGFDGTAVLVVMPPPPGLAAMREMRREMMGALDGIRTEIAAVRDEHQELRREKEALAAMQGEGLLAFVQKIDAESFKLLVAVLIHGDVAKAARALSMPDTTARYYLGRWAKGGRVYEGLGALIKWRKGKRLSGHFEFKDALDKVTTGEDREAVLAEVLGGLMSMTEGNWQDVCADLKLELRKLLS